MGRLASLVQGLRAATWACACLGAWACEPPPPPEPPLPPLHVEVEVDLELLEPVDAERLGALPPDLESGERRAWDLGPLIGEKYDEPGARLDVIDSGGTSVSFAEPTRRQDGRRPALVLNQKGEWFVELVDPAEDAAHGRGGNRGRPAARTQRMNDVAKLRVFTPSGGASRRRAAPESDVVVELGGEPIATWTNQQLENLPPLAIDRVPPRLAGARGLREAVATLPGGAKRVTGLEGADGRRVDLPEELWDDATRVPILRKNQRGQWKLEWIDTRGRRGDGPEVRGVARIELVEDAG